MSGKKKIIGDGSSEYEQYLRTSELLSLQKTEDLMAHHDELQFQVTHQSAELWMKLMNFEIEHCVGLIQKQVDLAWAKSLLRRIVEVLKMLSNQIHILNTMAPWDYHKIRATLGRGSGLDSPGFNRLKKNLPRLWDPYAALLKKNKVTIDDVYKNHQKFTDLFELAELFVDLDEHFQMFKFGHYRLASRQIGEDVIGTKGMKVDYLADQTLKKLYPELWDVRNRLTVETRPEY